MSRRPPPWFESWSAADAVFDRFVADLPLRREQLRLMVEASGGPVLDSSVESLDPLNEWYIEKALRDEPDGMDWYPLWMGPTLPASEPDLNYNTFRNDDLMRLWELISVYVADVVGGVIPHSRWVCFRARGYRERDNGRPAFDIGDRILPAGVFNVGNARVPRMMTYLGTGDRYEGRPASTALSGGVDSVLRRYERVRDAGLLTWQKAPTGPDAHRRIAKPTW